jgi:hypothetical protein
MLVAVATFIALALILLSYVLFLRPLFEKAGWVKPLPADVVTWRDRIANGVRNSVTIVWGWIVTLSGSALLLPQIFAELFNDPAMQARVVALIPNAKIIAILFVVAGVGTIIARLRTAAG